MWFVPSVRHQESHNSVRGYGKGGEIAHSGAVISMCPEVLDVYD